MANKIFTAESLETLVDEIKSHVNKKVSEKANISHTHSISDITNKNSEIATLTEVKAYLDI